MATTTLAEGLRFPEGPVAMPGGALALVEIAAGRITALAADGAKRVLAAPGGGPNGLARGPGGLLYVCNNGGFAWHDAPGLLRPIGQAPDYAGGRIETVDPATGEVRRLIAHCGAHALRGPNDLVFDPREGFWFTDLGKVRARDRDHGGVYWASDDGTRVEEVAYPVPGGANGIGLSPDGRVLYVAETETGRLWAFDVEAPGRLRRQPWPSPHGGRLLCQFPGFRRLDSLAVTAAGNVCVATLIAGEVTTVSPAGEILAALRFDDPMPTNLCFGGEGLRTAYVTLSTTGRVIAVPWAEPGLPLVHADG